MEKFLQEGVLLVDKPMGVSSHAVVNWARRCSGIKKIGHTGTLDPLATGLLILLIGRSYTKLQDKYLKKNKEYLCTAKLGLQTDSYDIDGDVITQTDWSEISKISREDIERAMFDFSGEIKQIVPVFSAVKRGGRKLYALMREAKNKQEDVSDLINNLPIRNVQVYNLSLIDFDIDEPKKEATFSFTVACSSGTYIRSLVHDIGQKLGVGATVVQLRRTTIGEISIDQAKMCPLFLKRVQNKA